ncbi:MAG: SIS domain-containing protein [Planctomycetes bacterium]|nr:SIS domain-containing protein [Planctomycetota bacterium]
MSVNVDYASEFRYREPVLTPDCLMVAISQSGETADTLAAIRWAQGGLREGAVVVNVAGLGDPARERRHRS